MIYDTRLVPIAALEAAINRCNATQGRGALRHAPGVPAGLLKHHIVLCKDAGLLAEVYGLMIFSRCELWPVSYTHLTLPTNREV